MINALVWLRVTYLRLRNKKKIMSKLTQKYIYYFKKKPTLNVYSHLQSEGEYIYQARIIPSSPKEPKNNSETI